LETVRSDRQARAKTFFPVFALAVLYQSLQKVMPTRFARGHDFLK